MKFKFDKDINFQLEAINSIVDIFETGNNLFGSAAVRENKNEMLFENIKIVKNALELDNSRIINNVHEIQNRNGLEKSKVIDGTVFPITFPENFSKELKEGLDFSIEMETGTGKTYVYLRTIFELNKRYGLKKFIILVPSVAIREGVLKTLQQTQLHFHELYNVGCNYFAYDSKKLSQVRDFSQNLDLQIMIMTVQSFNKDQNVMRQTPDRFQGESPLSLVAATNPIVIMDEPQNMESELTKSSIKDLQPLFKLRYSATHIDKRNLMYVLSPVDAYKNGLVKKIEVYGVEEDDPSAFTFQIKDIRTKKGKIPTAKVSLEYKSSQGGYLIKDAVLSAGDDLYQKTENSKYENLYVDQITAQYGRVELSDGKYYKLEEEIKQNKDEIFRTQIRETIKAHFNKQEQLGADIKVLSLFFIDKVENYVSEKGLIRRLFCEEFEKLKHNYQFFKEQDVDIVHNGYFSKTTERGMEVYKDTTGTTLADKEVYDLIMKDKEKLLSLSEPTSFIFSHSALREGWDNPNVFQICTLNETRSQRKKRQEIGRGLRLAVNKNGDRVTDSKINILTVIANESYKDFVGNLQAEYFAEGYKEAPSTSDARKRIVVKFKKSLSVENEEFKILWRKIQQKTKYNLDLDSEKLIKNSVEEINKLNIRNIVLRVTKVSVDFNNKQKLTSIYEGESAGERISGKIEITNILERIAKETGLTKVTIFKILSEINNLDLMFKNPEEYVRSITLVVNTEKSKLLINEGLQYLPINDAWELSLFEDFQSYESMAFKSEKSMYDHVVFDSDGEQKFAESLEKSKRVKLFVKLPPKFVVDTPLGTYNPDWAIVVSTENGEKLYLVRETKFGQELENLRPAEQQKIVCGTKHFESLGVNFSVAQKIDLEDLLNK